MKFFNTRYCEICGTDRGQIEDHHISYGNNETIMVCKSCHGKIHKTDGFHDELQPNMSREKAEERGLVESRSHGKTYSVYIKDDDLAEKIDRAIEQEYHNQAAFFLQAAKKEIDESDITSDTEDFV